MTPDEEARIRAEERERCARLVEKSEWCITVGDIKVSGEADSILQKQIAAAIRQGADTDYVCVRREDLRELLLYMAHVKGQSSDTYNRLRSLLKEKE